MQNHCEAHLAAEILLPELLQQLSGNRNEEIEKQFLIEGNQVVENVVNGEDNVEIMNGQEPFLLVFQPLRLFERPTLGTMTILSSLVMKLKRLANHTHLEDPAHRRRAAIQNRAHRFRLLIRKPMRLFILADMSAEDVCHIIFHPRLLRWRIVVMRYVSRLHSYNSLLSIFVVFSTAMTAPLFGIRLSKIDFRTMTIFAARSAQGL
jgi:hypothetical protein